MEFLLAAGVLAVVGAVVAVALPSWWWLAGPPALFAGVVVIAWQTDALDGEGGLAMAIFLLMGLPLTLFAMSGIAVGVAIGRSLRNGDAPQPSPQPWRPEAP